MILLKQFNISEIEIWFMLVDDAALTIQVNIFVVAIQENLLTQHKTFVCQFYTDRLIIVQNE